MQFKSTLILLIIFVVLGGYVYFAEYRGQEERQREEEASGKALPVDPNEMSEISLQYPDRTITAVRRGENQWEMTSPAGVEADSDEWNLLASNITRVERDATVASENVDAALYGLETPRVTVIARMADGREKGLVFGNENPRQTFNYAKLTDSPEVFLTPVSWSRLFEKTLTDMRNKQLLRVQTDSVDAIRFMVGGRETALERSEADWMLVKPIATRADNTEVTSFLSTINLARATDFADASTDARAAGLESPSITITLHDAEANADRTLQIGNSPEPEKYFARDPSRPAIFIIGADIPQKLGRPIFDWRDKAIARLNRDAIEAMEIVRGDSSVSVQKSGEDWNLADGRKAQWEKVSGMLNALEFEQASQINDAPGALSAYGIDRPRIEVTLRQGGVQALGVRFGNDSRDPEGVYLKRSDSPAVIVVPKDVFDKFNLGVDDLVESQPGSTP